MMGVGAFERRRYMNVVVQKARYPQLREYINSSITGLLPFIEKVCKFHFISSRMSSAQLNPILVLGSHLSSIFQLRSPPVLNLKVGFHAKPIIKRHTFSLSHNKVCKLALHKSYLVIGFLNHLSLKFG